MDGLDAFEKQLAAEREERERSERKHKHHKHRHHDRDSRRDRDEDRRRHRHSRRHESDDDDGDTHRSKRSKHSRDDDDGRTRRRHRDEESGRERRRRREDDERAAGNKSPSKGKDGGETESLVRDSWMTAPSSLDIDYVQRSKKEDSRRVQVEAPPAQESDKLMRMVPERRADEEVEDRPVSYTIGDEGSAWRMTTLKGIYSAAEEKGVPPEEIAMKRYGNLKDFDDAREEREELDKRKLYGTGYLGKEKPTGELYRSRKSESQPDRRAAQADEPDQGVVIPEPAGAAPPMNATALNRLRAKMMKAKLKRDPDAGRLEEEYNRAAAGATNASEAVVLGVMDNRQLAGTRGEVKAVETKRGRIRGNVEENDEMTIDDMVREERRTKGQAGGEGLRLAERIAKDGKFDNDLEYMDENAERLAKRVHKSEINLKNMAVNEFQKLNRVLENCPLCHHEEKNQPPIAPVVSLGTRVYLTLPTEPEIGEYGAVIVPTTHRVNLLECDDDEWEEIRNFMKSLTRMYHDQGREVVFYENAAAPHRHPHAAMVAVGIPYEEGATAPAYFKEAFLTSDDEWAQHRKVIDTGAKAREGMGRMAFRRCIAKEMPYFHVWFTLEGGLGHVVENAAMWPRGDLFAREVLGGMLDAPIDVIKKQGRWQRGDQRVDGFKRKWRKFDWTRVLTDG